MLWYYGIMVFIYSTIFSGVVWVVRDVYRFFCQPLGRLPIRGILCEGVILVGSERFFWLESLCKSLTNRVLRDPQDIYSRGGIVAPGCRH